MALLGVLAIVFGYCTWRYIERPFRDKGRFSKKTIFISAALMSAAMIGFGVVGTLSDGFVDRLSSDEQELLGYEDYRYESIYREGRCFLTPTQSRAGFSSLCNYIGAGNDSYLLWGDSHAASFSSGLRKLLPDAVIQYTASNCAPVINTVTPLYSYCENINSFVFSEIKRIKPTVIVLLANWINYDSVNLLVQLSKTIAEIKNVSATSKIVVVGSLPQWQARLPTIMLKRRQYLNVAANIDTPLLSELYAEDAKLKSVALGGRASFISALDALCTRNGCLATAKVHGKLNQQLGTMGT
jgi:hypothetical protein